MNKKNKIKIIYLLIQIPISSLLVLNNGWTGTLSLHEIINVLLFFSSGFVLALVLSKITEEEQK